MNGNDSIVRGHKPPMSRCLLLALSVLTLLLMVPGNGSAQVLYGTLVGNVKDPTGAIVPDATVTLTETGTALTRQVKTDSRGTYTVSTLTPGTYTVKISAQGFKTFSRPDVAVTVNSVSRVDATLQLGAVNQTVEVSASAAQLQTDRADVHHDLNAMQIQNIPMAPGNNFEHLFQAVPGINPPTSAHSIATNPSRALAFNSNGTSQLGNSIRLDGVSQQNIWVPENTAYVPSSDAIQTVNVNTNNYNIEEGFAGGTSANVEIKSGTNQFHGDGYEFFYSNALAALEAFAPRDQISKAPKDIFNQFGASVGGPIKKNKVFFFSNVELTRERRFATRTVTILTPAMVQGDLRGLPGSILGGSEVNPDIVYDPATGNPDGTGRAQIMASSDPASALYNAACLPGQADANGMCGNVIPTARLSPTAQNLLALGLPQPNLLSSSPDVPDTNFRGATDVSFNRITTDNKIDWNATDKFTMFGHFGFLHYDDFNPQIFGNRLGGRQISGFIGNEGMADGRTITGSVTANYVASPTLVFDANFGLTRMVTNSQQLNLNENVGSDVLGIPGTNGTRLVDGGTPQFLISGFDVLGTEHNFMPYFRNDPQFAWNGNGTWIHGSHTIKFGGGVNLLHLNHFQPEFNGSGTVYPGNGGFSFGAGPTQCKSTATDSVNATAANCFDTGLKSGKTSGSNSFNDAGTFLLGLTTGWGKNILVPDSFSTTSRQYAAYVGDTWQATSKLTVSMGTRWEYYPFPARSGTPAGLEHFNFSTGEVENCGEGGNPIDCSTRVSKILFAPRVGLAYRVSPTFVVRAGYGTTIDPFPLFDDLRTNFPIMIPLAEGSPSSLFAAGVLDAASQQNTPAGECAAFPAFCTNGQLPVGIELPNIPSLTNASNPIPGNISLLTATDRVTRGYIQSWNLTLEKQLPGGWIASAGYVATRSTNQVGQLNVNAGNPFAQAARGDCILGSSGSTSCGGAVSQPLAFNINDPTLCPSAASTALGCRTAATSIITPNADNHYDSLQTTLKHHFANGYDVGLAYTWSKTIGVAGIGDEKSGGPRIPLPEFYYLNHGLADFDRPSNLEATFIAQSPFGPGRRFASSGVVSKVLGGWQVSGLVTSVSGSVVSVNASGSSLNAPGVTQRPDILAPIQITHNTGPNTRWFDPSSFAGIGDQRFGTSVFQALHGPHLFNMDAAITRNFKLTERFNLQFRAQALNFTNTPAFSNPSGGCSSLKNGGCSSSTFGRVNGTTNFAREGDNFRQWEFNARISF